MVVRGQRMPSVSRAEAEARRERENLEWLAQFSTRHADELRSLLREEAEAKAAAIAEREQLEWMAQFSTRHADELRHLLREEADARQAKEDLLRFAESLNTQEAQWDPAKHPRGGFPQNHGWWSPAGGSVGSNRSPSFLDGIAQRNATVTGLTGVSTPGMMQSSHLAAELDSAIRLPGEVGRAGAAGFGTSGKAIVNGSATAIKNVATLGLSTSQLELIGVTKEDRERGYDTAVTIATFSGEVLIAVGTGGIVSALSKGGSIARAASGALLVYDAAGNAVGVVQGAYDARQNGVTVSNGARVAGGLLGLGANIKAARGLKPSTSTKGGRFNRERRCLWTIIFVELQEDFF